MNLPSRNEVHSMVDYLVGEGLGNILRSWNQNYDRVDLSILLTELGCGAAGCTKVCVPLNDEWVLKFPLVAPDGIRDWCALEAQNYALAKKAGFAEFFAPCYYWGEVDGLPVYVQRRVVKDSDEIESSVFDYCRSFVERKEGEKEEHYNERVQEFVDYEATDEDTIIANFCFLGDEDREKFFDFIEEREINDLHCGNFGFFGSRCVIFDYSGF